MKFIGKRLCKLNDNFANPRNVEGPGDKKILEKSKIPLKYFAYGFGAVEPMVFKSQSILEKLSK